jgi:hypothetical protein
MKVPLTDTEELPVLAPHAPVEGMQGRSHSHNRPSVRHQRRLERRVRRLYALGGLVVVAAFLAATIVVVDMVR